MITYALLQSYIYYILQLTKYFVKQYSIIICCKKPATLKYKTVWILFRHGEHVLFYLLSSGSMYDQLQDNSSTQSVFK